jgi:hypothetical protein
MKYIVNSAQPENENSEHNFKLSILHTPPYVCLNISWKCRKKVIQLQMTLMFRVFEISYEIAYV